ncbi:MAG TPA: homoserine kinase, partial [Thermoanaerobaculia bacterium]|nr:homoserine kinase [Thermoanaerobaculia bacterium]
MEIRAYAPASIGNFAAGFDLMGAALAPLDGSLWGDVVTAASATAVGLTTSGPHAADLPADPWQNLVLRTYALYREALRVRGIECPVLAFHLEKRLPRCSGLGSSASSVAATLAACQALLGEPLSTSEVFAVAGRAEALVSGSVHLDNVVPSLAGGLQILVPGPHGAPEARALPWPDDLILVVVSPALELSTERARKVLPKVFP